MHADQRNYLEKSLAMEASRKYQSFEDHDDWMACGHTFRVLCHFGKIFAVWRQTEDGPEVMGKFRIANIGIDTKEGVGVSIATDVRGEDEDYLWISHTPTRLFNLPIFAHVPYLCDISYTPGTHSQVGMVLRFPLVFKLASTPKSPVVGDIYVSQIGEFRATYPEFADLRL